MITKFKIFESKLILEKSFYDISKDEIFTKEFIKEMMEEDFVKNYVDVYREEENIDEEIEDSEIVISEEFKNFIIKLLEINYDNFLDKFEFDTSWIDDNKLKIFREITVDDNFIQHLKTNGKHLGKFWSWDEEAAEAHWADTKKPHKVLLTACIDEKEIDWINTIKVNIHPMYEEEKEITLFKNTPIKLLNIYINNEEISLDKNILNKTFYA